MIKSIFGWNREITGYKTSVINDPLGQTHSSTISNNYFYAMFVLWCFEKCWWMYGNLCENSYHHRPDLWVGKVDQYSEMDVCSSIDDDCLPHFPVGNLAAKHKQVGRKILAFKAIRVATLVLGKRKVQEKWHTYHWKGNVFSEENVLRNCFLRYVFLWNGIYYWSQLKINFSFFEKSPVESFFYLILHSFTTSLFPMMSNLLMTENTGLFI